MRAISVACPPPPPWDPADARHRAKLLRESQEHLEGLRAARMDIEEDVAETELDMQNLELGASAAAEFLAGKFADYNVAAS